VAFTEIINRVVGRGECIELECALDSRNRHLDDAGVVPVVFAEEPTRLPESNNRFRIDFPFGEFGVKDRTRQWKQRDVADQGASGNSPLQGWEDGKPDRETILSSIFVVGNTQVATCKRLEQFNVCRLRLWWGFVVLQSGGRGELPAGNPLSVVAA
jgi:hypothetical protein